MISTTLRRLAARPVGSAFAFGVVALTAAMLILLLGSTRSAQAALEGDIGRAWDTPYDLLIRPPGRQTGLEAAQGLVRPNFITGINGGVSLADLEKVRGIAGVEVAAPISVLGFVNWPSALELPLPQGGSANAIRAFRVTATTTGDAGLSAFPADERFIVVAPDGSFSFAGGDRQMSIGKGSIGCRYPTNCFAGEVCSEEGCEAGGYPSVDDARYYLPLMQPIMVAGIDPEAEAALAGLDGCVASGRYLRADDQPEDVGAPDEEQLTKLPVLVSTRSFMDQHVTVTISEAGDAAMLERGVQPRDLTDWSSGTRIDVSLAELYSRYLPSIHDYVDYWPLWSAGEVTYDDIGDVREPHLRAITHTPDLGVYAKANNYVEFEVADSLLVPPEARDSWFRDVIEHSDVAEPVPGTSYRPKIWQQVGQYDPACLTGFDPLAGGRLETYAYPSVRATSDGRELGPTRSMAGYVNSPPLLLTNLGVSKWLADPMRYAGQPGTRFISVIRVRVAGLGALPSRDAISRLAGVAAEIGQATGLVVDVVKGASPASVLVDLPAGEFGRPAMTVEEGWSRKGVAIVFLEAARSQDFALSLAIGFTSFALVAQAALVSVRRRRREFGILRALGWSGRRVAWLVEQEIVLLSVLSAVVAAAIALLIGGLLGLALDPRVVLVALLVTPVVAGLAGLAPARAAMRTTLATVHPASNRIRPSSSPRSLGAFALRDLSDRRGAAAIGIMALATSAALLGTLVILADEFRGRLDTTFLGAHLAIQAEPYHLVLGTVALLMGASTAGQVVTVGFLERLPEFATFRAIGWPRQTVLEVLIWQGLTLWLIAVSLASSMVATIGSMVGASWPTIGLGIGLAALAGLAGTAIAVAVPLSEAYRLSPVRSFEER